MPSKCVSETDALIQELDILRNVLLLAKGPADSLFNRVDDALRSQSIHKMCEAKASFERLPDSEKNWIFGMTSDDGIYDN